MDRQAPSVLLMGEVGTAKTYSIKTILAAGLEVFYLGMEPGWEDVLGDQPKDRFHPAYVAPLQDSFEVIMNKAKLIRDNTDAQLKAMGGINKHKHSQILDVMALCNDFVDMRTGEHFGDISTWGSDRCLVWDGLTGLTEMAIKIKIGDKPFMEQNDYYAAQTLLKDTIGTAVANSKCLFVLASHVERELNPNTSLNETMVSTVGRALAPKLPNFFSDVILTKRVITSDKPEWFWTTMEAGAKTKARNLPFAAKLPADFGPLIANWRKREAKP